MASCRLAGPGGSVLWRRPPRRTTERCFPASVCRSSPQRSAQASNLRFEGFYAPVALGQRGRHISGLEALRDVLRTIRIPGRNGEQDGLLGAGFVVPGINFCDQLGIILDDAGLTPDLDALPCA